MEEIRFFEKQNNFIIHIMLIYEDVNLRGTPGTSLYQSIFEFANEKVHKVFDIINLCLTRN